MRDYYALVLFLFKQLFVVFFEGLAFESQSDVRLLVAFDLLLQHESSYFLILEFVVEILGKRTFYFLVLFFQKINLVFSLIQLFDFGRELFSKGLTVS